MIITKEKIKDIRHDIEERLAFIGVNITGEVDFVIDQTLKKHLMKETEEDMRVNKSID